MGIVPRLSPVRNWSPQSISPTVQLIQNQKRPLTVSERVLLLVVRVKRQSSLSV